MLPFRHTIFATLPYWDCASLDVEADIIRPARRSLARCGASQGERIATASLRTGFALTPRIKRNIPGGAFAPPGVRYREKIRSKISYSSTVSDTASVSLEASAGVAAFFFFSISSVTTTAAATSTAPPATAAMIMMVVGFMPNSA